MDAIIFRSLLCICYNDIQGLTSFTGYRHGLLKRHDDDWKLRVSWRTQTRLRESRANLFRGLFCTMYIEGSGLYDNLGCFSHPRPNTVCRFTFTLRQVDSLHFLYLFLVTFCHVLCYCIPRNVLIASSRECSNMISRSLQHPCLLSASLRGYLMRKACEKGKGNSRSSDPSYI